MSTASLSGVAAGREEHARARVRTSAPSRAASQVIERLQKQMYGQHPNHPYTLKMKKAEAEFDVLAKKYADEAGIDPDDPHGNGNDPQRKPKA